MKKKYKEYRCKNDKNKNARVILSSKCDVSGNKTSRFIKEQEASGILSSVGIITPLS